LFGFGALGAVMGYTIGLVVSAIVSITLLYFFIIRKLPKSKHNPLNISTMSAILKPFLKFGIPFATSTILTGLVISFISIMMAAYCDISTIGSYKIALNFTILLTFFTIPISTVLFPAFSKINPQNERPLLKTFYASSAKYASLLLVPATLAIIVLGNSLIGTLYGDKWLDAPFFLSTLVLSNLLVLLGSLSINNLLLALGQTKFLLKINLLYLFVAIILGFTLIPAFGIIGVLIVSVASILPSMLLMFYSIWKRYGIIVDLKSSGKILLASMLAFFSTLVFNNLLLAPFLIKLILGSILFLGVFIIAVPCVGAVNHTDIKNLQIMLGGLGIVSKLLDVPLYIMGKLLDVISKMRT
jgi:O-antigen/teichoic acid export membrane protein